MDEDFRDIVELFDDGEKILKEKNSAKKQKLELEDVEELRLNSLETFGQTKSRKGEENSSKEPKNQWSSNYMIGFLREKNAQKNNLRQ